LLESREDAIAVEIPHRPHPHAMRTMMTTGTPRFGAAEGGGGCGRADMELRLHECDSALRPDRSPPARA
jgi:hypothetical protein